MATTHDRQLSLFPLPPSTLRQRLLGRLLWLANQQPLPRDPGRFYRLKARLLERHGHRTGSIWQQIDAYCRSCDGTGGLYEPGGCYRCCGSGIWERRYHRLEQWQLGRHQFLIPREYTTIRPPTVEIVGRVPHPGKGPAAIEAGLWLALLFDRGLFRQCLRQSPYWTGYFPVSIREAGFRPLLQLCRLLPWLHFWWSARCGWCGRKLWPWHYSRSFCSRNCVERDIDDPPF